LHHRRKPPGRELLPSRSLAHRLERRAIDRAERPGEPLSARPKPLFALCREHEEPRLAGDAGLIARSFQSAGARSDFLSIPTHAIGREPRGAHVHCGMGCVGGRQPIRHHRRRKGLHVLAEYPDCPGGLDRDVDVGRGQVEGLRCRLAGREEREQDRRQKNGGPQNSTRGASRAAASSTSKYSRGSKLKTPATMFVGTVSSALS